MSNPIDKYVKQLYTFCMKSLSQDEKLELMEERNRLEERIRQISRLLDDLDKGAAEKVCLECMNTENLGYFQHRLTTVYRAQKFHHLDGDVSNKQHGNVAVVCPHCRVHIMLSRWAPEDIIRLRMQGMNNANVGRLLGISRERVRQLSSQYAPKPQEPEEVDVDEMVRVVQLKDKHLRQVEAYKHEDAMFEAEMRGLPYPPNPPKIRLRDKRTIRKRVLAEIKKLGLKAKEK